MKKQVEYLQRLFYDLWNDFGSVYLLVKYSDRTVIGRRGFTDEEKKHGLVLLFNNRTNTTLNWDSEGNLTCVLAFGTSKEDVFIAHEDLVGVFSPEAGVQLVRSDKGTADEPRPRSSSDAPKSPHVVSLSTFRSRKTAARRSAGGGTPEPA